MWSYTRGRGRKFVGIHIIDWCLNPRPVRAFLITRTVRVLVRPRLVRPPPLAIGPWWVVELRGKPVDAPRRDLVIAHIVFGPRSIFDLVRSGQRSNFREKMRFLALHAHSDVSVVAIWNLHHRVPPFNSEQDRVFYCIPFQYLAYVVLLSRTASTSPAVIAVTVKIQIGRMTMIGQGDGEEVVWRRFRDNEPQIQIQHLWKPH